jgi:glycine/D-amino acid oxidase-like deaminating enzyme
MRFMKLQSFWLDTAPAFTGGANNPVRGRTDVVVVGGGFTGLSAALALAKRGIGVTLLEARRVASAASGRNGGHCNNGLSHDFTSVAARFGLERARDMYRAFDAGVDLVEALVAREAIDCDFARSGKLKLAVKPAHFDSMKRAQEVLAREVDADTVIIEKSALASEIGSDAYAGGLLQKRSASLHVGKFGVGLAHAGQHAGAVIHENTTVTGIERLPRGRFRVATQTGPSETGAIEADHVVLANGVPLEGPFAWFRRRIIPIGSFIIVTEPLGRARAQAIMPGRRNCTTTQNIGHYFRMSSDDRLVFGGRARFAMSSPTSDRTSGAILQATLCDVFPRIADCRIDFCWGGLVDMTADRLPRAGQHEGMHYAVGYSGHGVQMAIYMGDLMARRIAGETIANPWRDIPWPAIPLHFGKPWFLPLVGVYYRALDRLH